MNTRMSTTAKYTHNYAVCYHHEEFECGFLQNVYRGGVFIRALQFAGGLHFLAIHLPD